MKQVESRPTGLAGTPEGDRSWQQRSGWWCVGSGHGSVPTIQRCRGRRKEEEGKGKGMSHG